MDMAPSLAWFPLIPDARQPCARRIGWRGSLARYRGDGTVSGRGSLWIFGVGDVRSLDDSQWTRRGLDCRCKSHAVSVSVAALVLLVKKKVQTQMIASASTARR